ncbi:MAG TPA: sterol desaturase family protein [Acetobacteraceae bacterium]
MPGLGEQAAAWTLPAAAVVFLLLAVLETHRPRQDAAAFGNRWLTNLSLYGLIVGVGFLAAPQHLIDAVLRGWDMGPLAWLQRHGGPWLVLAAGLLLLDGLSYALHRMQHLAPLWRFHAVHHADTTLDATTGLRHHPGEYLVNAAVGGVVLALAGLPVWVVPVYGLVAVLSDLFTHANIALPPRLERALAAVVVTPGLHRIHHSVDEAHFNSNFGSVLTVWDRAFGTWRPAGPEALRFGVPGSGEQDFVRALLAPFRRGAG